MKARPVPATLGLAGKNSKPNAKSIYLTVIPWGTLNSAIAIPGLVDHF